MALHIHAALLTPHGVAANNRGLTEGNITTLQKLVWGTGKVHSTVSAESIRFALRSRFQESGEKLNRTYDDPSRSNTWLDPEFKDWSKFLDDDLLGFMSAKAAGEEGEKNTKVRRSLLEVSRAVSLSPWLGDATFNAASPGATPSAQKKGSNPVPYGTEMHATRYQYGLSLTPGQLKDQKRAATALRAICALGPVAGNHARFLFDFSPDSAVLRVTHDPAPRLLYCFDLNEDGSVNLNALIQRVRQKDILPEEIFLGGAVLFGLDADTLKLLGQSSPEQGVKAACEAAIAKVDLS
ncbi:type I-B CRISPR-associated protein Cas7/Cst2/DevR [Geothrix sp. 21YS21S-4]|uniref:type I-B CRISPR-associated protein Cas7/Cst2/DevR n=1 Tax=Geothrix sp. 21YS21S-4 TaxID=3068889 RepID=UPI0027BA0A09|nr:type I-B CRISPR-associated protein Cas7/Cst2/DevR [Geothrix sp. 21YS21S-4]